MCWRHNAGGGQHGSAISTCLVEVDTTHWYVGTSKCAHEANYEPPCNRCRVPVRVLKNTSGSPKYVRARGAPERTPQGRFVRALIVHRLLRFRCAPRYAVGDVLFVAYRSFASAKATSEAIEKAKMQKTHENMTILLDFGSI